MSQRFSAVVDVSEVSEGSGADGGSDPFGGADDQGSGSRGLASPARNPSTMLPTSAPSSQSSHVTGRGSRRSTVPVVAGSALASIPTS